jgi:hypothetical protein
MKSTDPAIAKVMVEVGQGPSTRQPLIAKIQGILGRPVVTYFTSFTYPVAIEDGDADVLESVLQKTNTKNGLALVINSPGGSGLAAERIIKVCRSYSDTGDYWAIAPNRAKSAATLVCFGASKIFMGPTSELGPVDPQHVVVEGKKTKWFSIHGLVGSYKDLFNRAVNEKGRLEPYLQQLDRYDEREMPGFERELRLSANMSARALKEHMMKNLSEKEIEKRIGPFLDPELTMTHGRAICRDEAEKCGLVIERLDAASEIWQLIFELYVRTSTLTSSRASKCVETAKHSFSQAVPQEVS